MTAHRDWIAVAIEAFTRAGRTGRDETTANYYETREDASITHVFYLHVSNCGQQLELTTVAAVLTRVQLFGREFPHPEIHSLSNAHLHKFDPSRYNP